MSRLTITLKAPTQVAAGRRADFLLITHRHLPGWVIRGALAAAWLIKHDQRAELTEFLELFEGNVRYGPGFLSDPPRSRALLVHKYDFPDCPVDVLDRATAGASTWRQTRCHECRTPLEGATLFPSEQQPAEHRRTSTQVGPDGTAVAGNLYSRDALRPHQAFTAEITPSRPEQLQLIPQGAISIGARRTTHGQADAQLLADDEEQPGHPLLNADGQLVLRLTSPAVFVDEDGWPSSVPDLGQISRLLNVSATAITARWTRWEQIGGWHAASKLPKPTEHAVAAGSTYLIALQESPTPEALTALADHGVGIRRHEGFGHLLRETRLIADQARVAAEQAHAAAVQAGHDAFARDWKLLDKQHSPVLGHIRSYAEGTSTADDLLAASTQTLKGSVAGRALRRTAEIPAADVAGLIAAAEGSAQ